MQFIMFDTEDQLVQRAESGIIAAGVVFRKDNFGSLADAATFTGSKKVEYDLRLPAGLPDEQMPARADNFFTRYIYPVERNTAQLGFNQMPYTPDYGDAWNGDADSHESIGFLVMQNAVDTAIASYHHTQNDMPSAFARVQKYPFPTNVTDWFAFIASLVIPLFFLLIYIYPVSAIPKELVVEKEERQRELLLMLVPSLYHTLWSPFMQPYGAPLCNPMEPLSTTFPIIMARFQITGVFFHTNIVKYWKG